MRALVIAVLAGCSFRPSATAPTRDGTVGLDVGLDVGPDVGDAPLSGKCGGKVWFADFSSDPTAYDNNGDGVNDFTIRGDLPFPTNQLVNGEWVTPDATDNPLDTMPGQVFNNHMFVDTRMRSVTTSGQRGAVFYLNLGYDGTSYAVFMADVKLTSATNQKIEFVNRRDPSTSAEDYAFATSPTNPTTPLDVSLEFDPPTLQVTYNGGGTSGTYTLERAPPAGDPPPPATLTAYSGAAAFDQFRMEVCP